MTDVSIVKSSYGEDLQEVLVTVAICTKNKFSHLNDCLRSVSKDNYRRKEILVVDSSNLDTAKKVKEITEAYGGRYLYESRKGLSVARNRAIKESSGDILIFTDDDCVVAGNWINQLVENYSNSDVMCITGNVIPQQTIRTSLFEKFMSHDKGCTKRIFSINEKSILSLIKKSSYVTRNEAFKELAPMPWCIGSGNNMSYRRSIFKLVGLFDENLGLGSSQRGGEDLDMFFRILLNGYKIVYEPQAVVYHNRQDVANGAFDYGRGGGSFMIKHLHDPYIALQYFARLINVMYNFLKASLTKNEDSRYMQYWYLRGLFSGLVDAHKIRRSLKNPQESTRLGPYE